MAQDEKYQYIELTTHHESRRSIANARTTYYSENMKRSKAINTTTASNGRKRGLVESTLLKIAQKRGYKITEVTPQQMARAKSQSRTRDMQLIAKGNATPEQIQDKNDMLRGTIEVLDWSPAFA
jgi:hypothetical protein